MNMKTTIQFSDTDELLDIRYDNVFKAVFTRNTPASKGALSDLISSFIGKKVTVASITANEPPIDDIRDRSVRFDISCKTQSGELVNIEMSLNPDSRELVRFEHYACKLFTRQDVRGVEKDYADLKEAYQIAILDKELYFNDEALIHTFRYYDPLHAVSLEGKSRIITVELAKAERVMEKPVDEIAGNEAWAAFFRYLTDRDKRAKINEILQREEGIAMASEVLIEITRDDIEWARQLSEEKRILDYQSDMASAKRKGRQEGQQQKALEVARNALAAGASMEIVKKITGLDMETIKSMQDSL
jgi:predicted transposase/invertase (TIGR01784 family)